METNGFLYDLLFSNIRSAKEIIEGAEASGIRELPNIIIVFSVDKYNYINAELSEQFKGTIRNKIKNLIQNKLNMLSYAALVPIYKNKLAVGLVLNNIQNEKG